MYHLFPLKSRRQGRLLLSLASADMASLGGMPLGAHTGSGYLQKIGLVVAAAFGFAAPHQHLLLHGDTLKVTLQRAAVTVTQATHFQDGGGEGIKQ